MHVGVLVNTIESPESIRTAGGNVHAIEVAKRWRGVDVTFFGPEFARRSLTAGGNHFQSLPSCEPWAKNRAVVFLFRSLASLTNLRRLRSCDILYSTSHFLPDVLPAILARFRRSAVCVHHIISHPRERRGSGSINSIAYMAERLSLFLIRVGMRHIIAGSRQAADILKDMGFRQPITITTNGVDHILELPAASGRSGALYVGRLHPSKCVDDLLRAWQLVVAERPDEKLVIVGQGDIGYTQYLRTLADELGLQQHVVWAGPLSDGGRSAALFSAKVFVFASVEEGWGIAIAEAMSAALPCVTYDLPVFRGIFVKGRVSVPIGDIGSFARGTLELFNDPIYWSRLSEEALTLSHEFSWQRAADIERQVLQRTFEMS
jgi:glycosyltransferase involved in cell wall biosynthesis